MSERSKKMKEQKKNKRSVLVAESATRVDLHAPKMLIIQFHATKIVIIQIHTSSERRKCLSNNFHTFSKKNI